MPDPATPLSPAGIRACPTVLVSGPGTESHDFFHDAPVHDDLHVVFLGQAIAFGTPDAFLNPDPSDSPGRRFPNDGRNVGGFPEDDDHVGCFGESVQRRVTLDVSDGFENRVDGERGLRKETWILKMQELIPHDAEGDDD